SLPRVKDGLILVCLKLSGPDHRLYPLLWRSKAAITLVTQRRQRALIRAADPVDQALGRDLLATRQELARLALAPAGAAGGPGPRSRALTERKEELERQLAERLPEFRRQELLDRRPAADLEQKLPPGTVFIDLVHYTYDEQDPAVPGRAGERATPS